MSDQFVFTAISVISAILWFGIAALQVYGMYTCFLKKWYLGAVALLVPGFALVIGGAKFFFNKDLLA